MTAYFFYLSFPNLSEMLSKTSRDIERLAIFSFPCLNLIDGKPHSTHINIVDLIYMAVLIIGDNY